MKRTAALAGILCLALSAMAAPFKLTTILVMDSTQALIEGATVQFSNASLKPLTTSWDGRVVFVQKGEADLGLTITAPYRDTLQLKLTAADAGQTVIAKMGDARYRQSEREEYGGAVYYGSVKSGKGSKRSGRTSDRVLYSKSAASSITVIEDDMEVVSLAAVDMAAPMPAAVEEEVAPEEVAVLGYGTVAKGTYAGSVAASNHLPSAGKLTAGEVNDFAKWAIWGNVLDNTHKQYISDWQMEARSRYVVQLTNKAGYPLADRAVSLSDSQGNTLFQARTDNTGKAELWSGLFGQAAKGKLFVDTEGQHIEAQPFQRGIMAIQLDEPCQAPEVADVFFIFDATGSMGDELRYLQAEMQDVIRRSQSAVEGLKIRTGALVYRDHTDEYVTRISRLSDDIEETQKFISAQSANGGGDYEEAIPEAMMAACNAAGWSPEARARIAFLVLDAPCHQDSATLRLLHEQTLNAAAQGIRIVPVVCSGLRESGELLMRTLALTTNGTSFFLTDDSGIGGTHLKPTTDSLKVEHLNDMLVRTIISFTRMPDCQVEEWAEEALEEDETDRFLPAPFEASDLDSVPAALPKVALSEVLRVRPNPCTGYFLADIPLGCDALFLCDMTGKQIEAFGAQEPETLGKQVDVSRLASGVYFLKAWYGARWYVQKVIVK